MSQIPSTMKAVVLHKAEGKPGQVWHPIEVSSQVAVPKPQERQVLVKLHAAAFNHREVFTRQSLYPGVIFDSILGADGAGVVVSPSSSKWYNKAVLLSPETGWKSSPLGPDQKHEFGILGGTKQTGGRGTFAEYIAIDEEDLVDCPQHLLKSWDEAAALPLAALTAYRAVFTKAEVAKGHNVLITGIGGGVAIQALQFAVAAGANVYVTSGSAEKLEQAKKLGAAGGVSYKEDGWPKKLQSMLPKDRPLLDSIVDSAGGDIVNLLVRFLKHGARVAVYGQTTGKPHALSMAAILKNIELRGSTMGSLDEFKAAIAFIDKHKIKPVVYKTLNGLEEAEEGFQILKKGSQFGKVVLRISRDAPSSKL